MSDKIEPFLLVITEGVHDVNAIAKLFKLRGFTELKKYTDIPSGLIRMIPRQYPSGSGQRLIRLVPHPTFLEQSGRYAAISNANGKEGLGQNLADLLLPLDEKTLRGLAAIAVVADMDDKPPERRQAEVLAQIVHALESDQVIKMETPLAGSLMLYEYRFPLRLFFLPDNQNDGTLETLLLAGAERRYPDLQSGACTYLDMAKQSYAQNLKGFNELKATVGVIANVLRPGKANQVSIGDDDWLTQESIHEIPSHIAFSEFIDSLINMLFE